MYREKINTLIPAISKTNDIDCLGLIDDLIEAAAEYIKRVNVLEAALITAKISKEPEEYREYVQRLDKSRSSAHNNLISNVKIVNRLCRSNNVPVIFEGNEEMRIEIAEFALELSVELFSSRRL